MRVRHVLKCWPEPFQAVLDGRKTAEWRRNDRGYAVGDVLVLQEFTPLEAHDINHGYTGRSVEVEVTHLVRGQFDIPDGYVVMSIRRMPLTLSASCAAGSR